MANYCNTKDCIDKFNLHKKNEISSPYTRELEFKELTNSQEKVVLETKFARFIFFQFGYSRLSANLLLGR